MVFPHLRHSSLPSINQTAVTSNHLAFCSERTLLSFDHGSSIFWMVAVFEPLRGLNHYWFLSIFHNILFPIHVVDVGLTKLPALPCVSFGGRDNLP